MNMASSVFPIAYEIDPQERGKPWVSRIDFYNGRFAYSEIGGSQASRDASDAGGRAEYSQSDSAYYVKGQPIIVSKGLRTDFQHDELSCTSFKSGDLIKTECGKANEGKFVTLHHAERGVVAMRYYCNAYANDICGFEAKTGFGLFSRQMNTELGFQ